MDASYNILVTGCTRHPITFKYDDTQVRLKVNNGEVLNGGSYNYAGHPAPEGCANTANLSSVAAITNITVTVEAVADDVKEGTIFVPIDHEVVGQNISIPTIGVTVYDEDTAGVCVCVCACISLCACICLPVRVLVLLCHSVLNKQQKEKNSPS